MPPKNSGTPEEHRPLPASRRQARQLHHRRLKPLSDRALAQNGSLCAPAYRPLFKRSAMSSRVVNQLGSILSLACVPPCAAADSGRACGSPRIRSALVALRVPARALRPLILLRGRSVLPLTSVSLHACVPSLCAVRASRRQFSGQPRPASRQA